MNQAEFLGKSVKNLLKDGFSLRLINKNNHKGYGGWFDAEKKEFLTCFGGEAGFEIFVHEYCHFLQYKYSPGFWEERQFDISHYFHWLDGQSPDLSPYMIQKYMKGTIELEWDCETKASKIVGRNDFGISKLNYCRGANIYLFSYHFITEFRKWPTKPLYSDDPEILEMSFDKIMPLEFYYKKRNCPKDLRDLLRWKLQNQ